MKKKQMKKMQQRKNLMDSKYYIPLLGATMLGQAVCSVRRYLMAAVIHLKLVTKRCDA
jgi:hypothetical protein